VFLFCSLVSEEKRWPVVIKTGPRSFRDTRFYDLLHLLFYIIICVTLDHSEGFRLIFKWISSQSSYVF